MTSRRHFLQRTALAAAGMALGVPALAGSGASPIGTPIGTPIGAPDVLTSRRTRPTTRRGTLVFRPTFVQRGRGPHLLDWAYASDERGDAFYSDITASAEGVALTDAHGQDRFAVNVRWNVEGFGYLFLTADNAGRFYALPPEGHSETLDLGVELARSRVARNRRRLAGHADAAPGYAPSREARALLDLSEGYFEDAERAPGGRRAAYAQDALRYALLGAEALELDAARQRIAQRGHRDGFHLGCDARAFYQMDPDTFLDRFTELFDYATITHYLVWGSNALPDFEPAMGDRRYDTREALLGRLRGRGVAVQGRPLFYTYPTVTPDWLRRLSYDDLLRYVERHVREVVGHYGERMVGWEIVNELHDWANEARLAPDQAVELTRLACDVARDTAPNLDRIINTCCPFGEYVQMRKWVELDAEHPQRTPWQFLRDLTEAGVDYTVTGQQMYFPYRDLQDIAVAVERMADFGRPVHLTEIGASSGPSPRSVLDGSLELPTEPPVWHRPWDEALQADWAEAVYTLAYANPHVAGASWYDFLDGPGVSWIPNGGLLTAQGEKKALFDRLAALRRQWGAAPGSAPLPGRTGASGGTPCTTC